MDKVRIASKSNPIYTVNIATADYLDLRLDDAIISLKLTETDSELAQKVTINLVNCTSEGKLLSELLYVRDRVFIYANDGEEVREVFRGYVWKKDYTNSKTRVISLTCYDNLIYLQKSEDSRYYSSGKKTEEIVQDICWAWDIGLQYNYDSIIHKKLPLQGTVSDMLLDVLDKVKKNTDKKYVVRSKEDVIYVEYVGSNDKVYEINRTENAISTSSTTTLNGVVTKILLLGSADEDDKVTINDTIEGDTKKWGTLQKIMKDDSEENGDTSSQDDEKDKLFENARDEADYKLKENGKPKDTFKIGAINNPWMRKGDLVKVFAGDMTLRYIITSIMHDAVKKKMNLELELADDSNLSREIIDTDFINANTGRKVDLINASLYSSSDSQMPIGTISGSYYLYDGKKILDRYRITQNRENIGKLPMNEYVVGWISNYSVIGGA